MQNIPTSTAIAIPTSTAIKDAATLATTNTVSPIESTPNNGVLIGKIIAMNLRNRLTQASNKALTGNMS